MGDAWDTAHQHRIASLQAAQGESLSKLVDVMAEQARDAERSRRSAWWFSMGSLAVAAGSLVVAILAILVR